MPAPTALMRKPEELAEGVALEATDVPLPIEDDAELIDMNVEPTGAPDETLEAPLEDTPMTDETGRPKFGPGTAIPLAFRREQRKVAIPRKSILHLLPSCNFRS